LFFVLFRRRRFNESEEPESSFFKIRNGVFEPAGSSEDDVEENARALVFTTYLEGRNEGSYLTAVSKAGEKPRRSCFLDADA